MGRIILGILLVINIGHALTVTLDPYKDLDYSRINAYYLHDNNIEECSCPEYDWMEF